MLRQRFAESLSEMYGMEVPAYRQLVEVSHEINREVAAMAYNGTDAHSQPAPSQLMDADTRTAVEPRVSIERHGAIRLGTPSELALAARLFALFGMYPVGFYDLRDARPQPVPVVSTCFRPIEADALAACPFRVFTSLLVPSDRRFFTEALEAKIRERLSGRQIFTHEMVESIERAELAGGVAPEDCDRFLELARSTFAISNEPVEKELYEELLAVSSVAADIAAEPKTHLNHLTPRVLDIDDLYRRMTDLGVQMIDRIQGPPRWGGPLVLLRQTSFRALDEERELRDVHGRIRTGKLRVRFGEVEARGVALTPTGRDLYDRLVTEAEFHTATEPGVSFDEHLTRCFEEGFPRTHLELAQSRLAYYRYRPNLAVPVRGRCLKESRVPTRQELLTTGAATVHPITYEDFLPKSAAGIFQSNLVGETQARDDEDALPIGQAALENAMGRPIRDPYSLYAAEEEASYFLCLAALGFSAHRPEPDAAASVL